MSIQNFEKSKFFLIPANSANRYCRPGVDIFEKLIFERGFKKLKTTLFFLLFKTPGGHANNKKAALWETALLFLIIPARGHRSGNLRYYPVI
jgi:hypothetical protein